MNLPPPPYQKSASVSRSDAGQQDRLGSMADALLPGRPPRSVSSSTTSSTWDTTLTGGSRTRGDLEAVADAMLRSSLSPSSQPASFTSASVSRTKASRSALGVVGEARLRSPVARSVLSPALPLEAASVSHSQASKSSLETTAEAMLRSSVPSGSSWTSSVPTPPPSYRTAQHSPRGPKMGAPVPPANLGPSAAESKRRVRQVQSAVKMASSATPARNTKGLFKAVCSTDLLFLIDTTSSMQGYIDAAKDQVRSIIADIQHAFLGESTVRIAVVGYKDHCDSSNVNFLDFTTSMDQVQAFLGELSATGGGDPPEDVLGGIQQAVNAAWMQPTRCIIHIADAPGHSHALHDFPEAEDSYYLPGSEPHGLTYAPLIRTLVKQDINYTFLKILSATDRMLMEFSRVYEAAGAESRLHNANGYYGMAGAHMGSKVSGRSGTTNSPQLLFQELPLGIDTRSLRGLVLRSVTDSVTRTASRHSTALGSSKLFAHDASHTSGLTFIGEDEAEPVDVCLEATPPQWNSPGWLDKKLELEGYCPEVVVFSESTLGDMIASDDHIKLSFAQLTVHARSKPFGQGAQRLASYARIAASPSKFVVKSFTSGGKGLEHLIEDMRMQALCKAFALEFNGLVRPERAIDFVVTACLHNKVDAASGEEGGCLSLEPYLAGDYVKYNSNGLYVREDTPDDPINRVAQAFSHFTFERSWGDFLVVDLQGVGNLFTDPAIHTKDPERFKLNDVNCSTEGFKFFFAQHWCNEVCRQLGLVSNRDMALSGDWQFRQQWPSIEPTVCCSNKFCQSIIRLARANVSPKFPGYRWCNTCWPELQASTVQWICVAPGPTHEFDMSRFFYASQGKLTPRKCPEHVDKDMTAYSTASVGGGLWSKMKSESRTGTVLGNEC